MAILTALPLMPGLGQGAADILLGIFGATYGAGAGPILLFRVAPYLGPYFGLVP